MYYIAQAGGQIKYGHNEVGNFTLDGKVYEQNEIEFLPVPAEEAADQLMVAKWIIRNLGMQMGFDVTFAPKITAGKAGSGLHIHFKLMDGDTNVMTRDGRLSDEARKAIAGILEMSPAITAFGNKVPTSYLRLVPHQEAPTNICWGDRNRSVLVRVPLGWTGKTDMCAQAALASLPDSCVASADALEQRRAIFEKGNIFSAQMIDGIIAQLRGYDDTQLRKQVNNSSEDMLDLVHKYWHCG